MLFQQSGGLHDAVEQLKRLQKPFLDWTGKAERLSFDVPTLPLFVHERLSTKAIIETLKDHKKQEKFKQLPLFELFGDPQRPVTDQVLKAYEYRDKAPRKGRILNIKQLPFQGCYLITQFFVPQEFCVHLVIVHGNCRT